MAADIFKDCARGAHKVLSTVYKTAKMYAMAWNEPKRKFFVSTCGTTVAGDPGMRRRYRNKLDPETGITYSEAWYKSIPNPLMLFWYFRAASAIDEHNQARQGDLALEDIIVTRSWWIRVITTLIGMCIIDAWKAQRYFQEQHKERPLSDFLDELATELVNYAAAPADRLRQQAAPPADSIEEAVEAHVREHELRPLIELPYYQEEKKSRHPEGSGEKQKGSSGRRGHSAYRQLSLHASMQGLQRQNEVVLRHLLVRPQPRHPARGVSGAQLHFSRPQAQGMPC
jgi:hypothetical protein